jgi:predicted Zn finger-like uncharacterized protein
MILTCPSCNTRYNVDTNKIGSIGRTVRCASCKHTWRLNKSPIEDAVLVPEQKNRPSKPKKAPVFKKSSHTQKIFFTSIILLLLATSFFSFRHSLVTALPQLAPIYQALNIATLGPHDLSFEGVHITPTGEPSEKPLFMISGSVLNRSDRLIHAPKLRAHILGVCDKATWLQRLSAWIKGHKSCSLSHWPLTLKDNTLFPGEEISFSSFPLLLPDDIDQIEIRFD